MFRVPGKICVSGTLAAAALQSGAFQKIWRIFQMTGLRKETRGRSNIFALGPYLRFVNESTRT